MAAIALGSFALLSLLALLSVIDFPSLDNNDEVAADDSGTDDGGEPDQRIGDAGSGSAGAGGSDGGQGGERQNEVRVEPIPGCDGFILNGEVAVIEDPEACGLRPLDDQTAVDQGGRVLQVLVPDPDGTIGGFNIDDAGRLETVPVDDVGAGDFTIARQGDGRFDLEFGDGTTVRISSDGNGLSITDTEGNIDFVPSGSGGTIANRGSDELGRGTAGDDGEANPNQGGIDEDDFDQDDFNQDRDDSFLDSFALLPLLFVLGGLVLLALVLAALVRFFAGRDKTLTPGFDHPDQPEDGIEDDVVDYSTEIDALDRLLWEIGQEPDPRAAIRRVYAALETGLGNPELARQHSETPGLFLQRILGRFDELEAPLRELTTLFERARFSEHQITPPMRDRAIAILVDVRHNYTSRMNAERVAAEPSGANPYRDQSS